MNKKAVIVAIGIFILIVAGMFIFAYLKSNEGNVTKETESTPVEETDEYSHITRIEGKHYYIDGVHTVVGELPMPTPCDLLEANALVDESYPERITLDFKVVNNAEFCAEVVTPARFKVSAPASPEATFTALFQNRVVELNLIEAAPGERPEDFELFIKG